MQCARLERAIDSAVVLIRRMKLKVDNHFWFCHCFNETNSGQARSFDLNILR